MRICGKVQVSSGKPYARDAHDRFASQLDPRGPIARTVRFDSIIRSRQTSITRAFVPEIGASIPGRLASRVLGNRFVATAIAVMAIAFFAFYEIPDAASGVSKPAGLVLWTLFGTTNQMLAGLTLLVATLYLYQRGRNPLFTGIPMVFMLISTLTALAENLAKFWRKEQYLLLTVGLALVLGIEKLSVKPESRS